MDLTEYRNKLDRIDEQILELFIKRMDIAAQIAAWKQENSLPVLDVRREKEKLARIEEMSPSEISDYSFTLFAVLMEQVILRPLIACTDDFFQLEPLEVLNKIPIEVAGSDIIAVAKHRPPCEMRLIILQFAFYITELRIELVILVELCIVQ